MLLIGQNKHSKFTYNTLYFACNNNLCSAVLTNLLVLGDLFLCFLPHLSLEEGIGEEYQEPKVAKNLSLAIDASI